MLNLVPWGGVALRLPAVALQDPGGWDATAAAIAAAYISDITTNQVSCTRWLARSTHTRTTIIPARLGLCVGSMSLGAPYVLIGR